MSEISAVRQADEWTLQVELGDPMTEIYTLQAATKEDFIMWMVSDTVSCIFVHTIDYYYYSFISHIYCTLYW